MEKREAPDEKDEEDDVGEGGGEVNHLAAGLDSLWSKNCWSLNEDIHLVSDGIQKKVKKAENASEVSVFSIQESHGVFYLFYSEFSI